MNFSELDFYLYACKKYEKLKVITTDITTERRTRKKVQKAEKQETEVIQAKLNIKLISETAEKTKSQ